MPINNQLLIAAPMLQNYLVDKTTGLPLAGGTITLYQDNSRTTLKNWYYQSGIPGAYSYIALPNPMTLSGVGTPTDGSENDVLPLYYPYSEVDNVTPQPYYIDVKNSDGEQQFTRQNFPFIGEEVTPVSSAETFENVLINNVFWRNVGSLTVTNLTSAVLAPSAHAGYAANDIQFLKSVTGATDTIAFTKFTLGTNPLVGDITPEFYCNFQCSVTQAGETLKCVQIPINLHVKNLEGERATFTIQAKNVSGSANNTLTISIYSFFGTGVTSPSPVVIKTITLGNAWTKYTVPFVFPSDAAATLGAGGDDAYYVQIGFPLSLTCNIDFAVPSLYLGDEIPTNAFQTYDDVDSYINSPRTGDRRTSFNDFAPFGWVPCNDGSIGSASSGATARANQDTWQLYNLFWNKINNAFAPVATGRGVSAIADFAANKAMTLPLSLGRTSLGLPAASSFTYVNGTGIFTVSSNAFFYIGSPVYLTNTGGAIPSGFTTGTIYYAMPVVGSVTTLQVATTYANAIAGTAFVPSSDDGSGTNLLNIALGGSFGESRHTQLLTELVSHTHTYTKAITPLNQTGSDTPCLTASATDNTGSAGSGNPFNIIQPSVYCNIFLKL